MVNDDNLNSQEAGGLFPRLQERFGLRRLGCVRTGVCSPECPKSTRFGALVESPGFRDPYWCITLKILNCHLSSEFSSA